MIKTFRFRTTTSASLFLLSHIKKLCAWLFASVKYASSTDNVFLKYIIYVHETVELYLKLI